MDLSLQRSVGAWQAHFEGFLHEATSQLRLNSLKGESFFKQRPESFSSQEK